MDQQTINGYVEAAHIVLKPEHVGSSLAIPAQQLLELCNLAQAALAASQVPKDVGEVAGFLCKDWSVAATVNGKGLLFAADPGAVAMVVGALEGLPEFWVQIRKPVQAVEGERKL